MPTSNPLERASPATLRWLLAGAITVLGTAASGAAYLETNWRAARTSKEAQLQAQIEANAAQIASLAATVEKQLTLQAVQQRDLIDYRQDLRAVQQHQIDSARQLQRALDALERGKR